MKFYRVVFARVSKLSPSGPAQSATYFGTLRFIGAQPHPFIYIFIMAALVLPRS